MKQKLEPIVFTEEEFKKEQKEIEKALNKPKVVVPYKDSLLGEEVKGFKGIYWYSLETDPTETGFVVSGNGIRLPCTVHIPTGSKTSYRKVYKVLNGKPTSVWEVHQKDLSNEFHEVYGDEIA